MFGLFSPKPPLRTAEKAWVESRMQWLAEHLGLERMLKARVILPTDEHFPGVVVGEPSSANAVFDRLCEYMEIDRSRVKLTLCSESELSDWTGLYVGGTPAEIKIRDWLLDDPEQLVATLAHELAHEILLGGGLLNTNNEDLERLTDLLPAYLGVGAFAANATVKETNFHEGRSSWWKMARHGYLPSRHFGYAMALFSFVRQDSDTSWARMLRPDVAEPFRAGLKYLRKTKDSLFNRESAAKPADAASAADLLSQFDSPSATVRIHTLWELNERVEGTDSTSAIVDRVTRCLDDRDVDIVAHAADTLGEFGPAAAPSATRLVEALHGRSESVRTSAAYALGKIAAAPELVVAELIHALDDDELVVVKAAAWALGRYGPAARPGMKALLRGYERFLKRADDGIDVFAQAIVGVAGDPTDEVDAYFAERDDGELHLFAIEVLQSAMEDKNADTADAADL